MIPARWRAAAGLAATVLLGYLLFTHTTYLVPDSAGTYAWARSLLFDRDIDFGPEYARLGSIEGSDRVRFARVTATGRPGNPFGMGSGLLWLPFVAVAEGGLRLAGAAVTPGGYSTLHLLAASAGTAIYGLVAVLLTLATLRRMVSPRAALWATVGAAFGTPFLAYLYHLPTYAHVDAAFGAAVALAASVRARERDDLPGWTAAGAAVGLAAVIRAQHLALLAVPVALWAAGPRRGRRRGPARPAAIALGCLAVFSIQLLAWWRLYGSPLEPPQGEGFLDLRRPALLSVLFSPWHGLFPWAPLLLLAVPGIWMLGRRDRALAWGSAIAIGAEVYLAASAADWWGGYAIGARRLVDLTPLFALALAPALAATEARLGAVWARGMVAAGIVWNLALTAAVRSGVLSPFRELAAADLARGLLDGLRLLPAYLWREAMADRTAIHFVVHRDAPLPPTLDPAPAWLVAPVLAACWGLAVVAGLLWVRRATRREVDTR